MNRPGAENMDDMFRASAINRVPRTVPINPDAKPYEPGYDWVAHGHDELDDHIK